MGGTNKGVTKEFDRSRDKLLETEVTAELLECVEPSSLFARLCKINITCFRRFLNRVFSLIEIVRM